MSHQVDAVVINRKVALHLVDHVDHVAFGRGKVHRIRPAPFRADDYIVALFGDAADRAVVVRREETVLVPAHSVQRDDHRPFLLRVVIGRDVKPIRLYRVVDGRPVGPLNVAAPRAQRVFAFFYSVERRRGVDDGALHVGALYRQPPRIGHFYHRSGVFDRGDGVRQVILLVLIRFQFRGDRRGAGFDLRRPGVQSAGDEDRRGFDYGVAVFRPERQRELIIAVGQVGNRGFN